MKRVVLLLLTAACSLSAAAAFQTASGYAATEVIVSESLCGGLAFDSGILYFGNGTQIRALDLAAGTVSDAGTIESNSSNALVVRHNGTTWTSYTIGYYPGDISKMGYLDAGGTYHNQWTSIGIWDAAVSPSGECYVIADPGHAGTALYRFDLQTGQATLTANLGGWSGGIAFDSQGSLYYADQTSGDILKFTAAQLQAGGLTAAGGQSVLQGLYAGFIGFDAEDRFYATTAYGSTFAMYDLAAGEKVKNIATGDIGQFVVSDEAIYLISNDWSTLSSTIMAVYPVPEPATLLLLSAGIFLTKRKR